MDKLYYISQADHLQNIQNVCEAGVRLVQLRMKNLSATEEMEIARKAQNICKKYNAMLLINDNVALAHALKADGVHLGKNDGCPLEARKVLGDQAIIGGTANTYEDCLALIAKKVNYVGLGPFQFTTTKEKLSPVLGWVGYQHILTQLQNEGHLLPVYAIGGITLKESQQLETTPIHGIAVSGFISNKSVYDISQELSKCHYFNS